MEIRGVLLRWGKNDRGYRWIDVEGLRLDVGKNDIPDSVLNALVGQKVEAYVQVQWVRAQDGRAWPRRRVLAVKPLG